MAPIRFLEAVEADMDELMTWFPTAADVNVWGGPKFRYPFTRETFRQDCRWPEMQSYVLRDDQELLAFGQFYERLSRINLARLIANPGRRGEGVGRHLVEALLDEGPRHLDCAEYSLFVYRDNTPALRCYESCGFRTTAYPKDTEWADECYYLTRPVGGRKSHAS